MQKSLLEKYWWISLIIIGIILLVIFINANSPKNVLAHKRYDACMASHEYVLGQLKNPYGAEFEDCSQANVEYLGIAPIISEYDGTLSNNESSHDIMGLGVYQINSYVDAQNSFGAMIRTRYSTDVYYINEWKLFYENIRFYDN